MRRTLQFPLLLALLAFASILPCSAYAGSGSWTRISSAHGSKVSDEEIGLIRRSGGALGVAWIDHTGGSSALKLSTVAAGGAFKGAKAIVTGWDEIGGPDAVPTAGAGARIFFSGRKDATGPAGLRTALATNGSSPFQLEPELRGASGFLTAGADVGTGVTSVGDPITSYTYSTGVYTHFGLTPSQDFDFQKPVSSNGSSGFSPDIASAPGSGGTNIGWFSNAGTGDTGVYSTSVNPTTGAPAGPPMLMPGSADAELQYSRTPITGRPTRGGVYMAYRTGDAFSGGEVRVWLVGAKTSTVLFRAKSGANVNSVGIAADSKNRLWVFWSVSTIFGGKVYATRSDAGESKPGVLSFANPKAVPLPKGGRIVDQLYGDAQTGKLDLVAKFRLKGTNSWWHRQVAP